MGLVKSFGIVCKRKRRAEDEQQARTKYRSQPGQHESPNERDFVEFILTAQRCNSNRSRCTSKAGQVCTAIT
jgi:hypothetical protein